MNKDVRKASNQHRPWPLLALSAIAAAAASPQVVAAPNGVVISEFRARGPAGGNDEFVELLNTGSAAVSIGGWKLNGCASGTPGSESTRATIPAGITLQPGQHYLFTNSASGGYSGSVAGDQTYATGFTDFQSNNFAGIALRDSANTLQDGVGSPQSPCREGSGITTSTTNPSTQTSRSRLANETQDTGDNAADFAAEAAATPSALGGGSEEPTACPNDGIAIYAIQGAGHLSPYRGQCVANVAGVVTQRVSNGFYLQHPTGDGNDATSDGIFVFTSSAPAASITVGSEVKVSGTVDEYRPGSSFSATNCASTSAACNLTVTEIVSPVVTAAPGTFPNPTVTPTVLGSGGRIPPSTIIDNDTSGSVEVAAQTTYDPAEDGLDFYESLEGMLVQVNNLRVIGPTNSFGEIWVVGDNGDHATGNNARGGLTLGDGGSDYNPERIQLDLSGLLTSSTYPKVHVGATAPVVIGSLTYNFGDTRLFPISVPEFTASPITREPTSLDTSGQRLTIASYNVENLDPNDDDTCDGRPDRDIADGRFSAAANQIVSYLRSPDILGLEEIQDNSGCTNDGVVDANLTLETLISAITAAGGPTYAYTTVSPTDGTDGGAPGANIRQAFLYNPARVSLIAGTSGAGNAQTATAVSLASDGKLQLSLSPGRIDPTNPAFASSRKPLAALFEFQGQRVLAVVNHFNSKGGDYPLFGRFQPAVLTSEAQRIQQAQALHDFVDSALTLDPNANVIALGDFNDFEWSAPMRTLTGASSGNPEVLLDLATLYKEPAERYSYVFEGNSQELDHIYVSPALLGYEVAYDAVHVNAEFADQLSDHDPIIASIGFSGGDDTPDAFDFTDVSNAALDRYVISANLRITGIDAGTRVSISTGGEYRINKGAWTTAPGTLNPRDQLQLRLRSANAPATTSTVTITVGSVSDSFAVTTEAADTQPDELSFASVEDAKVGKPAVSEIVKPTGFNTAVPLSVTGGEYRIKTGDSWAAWTTGSTQLAPNQRLQLRVTPDEVGATVAVQVTLGSVSTSWQVTAEAADTTPDPFPFDGKTVKQAGKLLSSAATPLRGFNVGLPLTVSGGEYRLRIGGVWGEWTSAPTVVNSGTGVQLRTTSGPAGSVQVVLQVGEASSAFTVTTAP